MRWIPAAVTLALLAAACAATAPPTPSATVGAITTTAETPTATTGEPTTPATQPVCLAGDVPFNDAGVVASLGGDVGDATTISSLRWEGHALCERLIIDLATDGGAPAGSLGETTVSYRADVGIVRVELPATTTAVADNAIEAPIVRRLYVVRRTDGTLAVDAHVGTDQPVVVRSFVLDEPTRIVVDLGTAPEGLIPRSPPATGELVVVTNPLPGRARYPLVVSGYARTFEANVIARVVVDGEVAAEAFATATDWLDAWGEFEVTIDEGPVGSVTLLVGGESARDGRFSGVSIDLELS